MAARKKTAAKKKAGDGQQAVPGKVRFKIGFPPDIREYINQRYGDDWHLSLQILDGDDGDGDDGDAEGPPFTPAGIGGRAANRRSTSRKSAKKSAKKK